MSTFISVKPHIPGYTFDQLVEHIYLRARSCGYTREEAIASIANDLQAWMNSREREWERMAQSEIARNEQLRTSLISLRDKINLALRDGT